MSLFGVSGAGATAGVAYGRSPQGVERDVGSLTTRPWDFPRQGGFGAVAKSASMVVRLSLRCRATRRADRPYSDMRRGA